MVGNFNDRQSAFSTGALILNEDLDGSAFFSGPISERNSLTDMVSGDKFFCIDKRVFEYDGTKWKNITHNFSFRHIQEDDYVEIPKGQQMILKRSIKVEGTLNVKGDLWLQG